MDKVSVTSWLLSAHRFYVQWRAACTPKHLAEQILTSKGALEGERKQVTMLFAELKGCAARRPRPRECGGWL